jgi:hypothetical protein
MDCSWAVYARAAELVPCRAGLPSAHGAIRSRYSLIGRRVAFEARAQPGSWLHTEELPPHQSTRRIYPQRMQV